MGVALTHNGQNHDHEVKDVPPDGEVVVPQGEHLQHTLAGEEDDKHQVDPVEDVLHLLALRVRLHHHGHHVEADEHHDDDVKCLLSDEVKDSSLNAVLCNEREAMSQTGWNKNLPSVNKLVEAQDEDTVSQYPLKVSRHAPATDHSVWERQEDAVIYIPITSISFFGGSKGKLTIPITTGGSSRSALQHDLPMMTYPWHYLRNSPCKAFHKAEKCA